MKVVRKFAQKEKHHQDDQQHGDDEGALDVAYRRADGDGLVHRDGQVDGARDGGFQLRQSGADAVDGLNNVGAGLAEDDHQHGGLAVQITGLANVFHRIDRLAHIADAHGDAVAVGDHQRLVIDGFQDLIVGAHFPHVAGRRRNGLWAHWRWRRRARCAPIRSRCRTCSARWDSVRFARRAARCRPP